MLVDSEKFFLKCAEKEMNLTEAIKKAGLSPAVLRGIKTGKNISSKALGKIAAVLGCKPADLVV